MTSNPLSNLKIDRWYKILPVIGAVTLVLSLTVEMKVSDNLTVLVASIGVILFGIGEWINHPLQVRMVGAYKITSYNRVNTFWGNLWSMFGVGLIIYAVYTF